MDIQVWNFIKVLETAVHEDIKELTEPNWNKLYGYAIQHSLLPIFYEGCNKYHEFLAAPEEIKNRMLLTSHQMITWQAKKTEIFLRTYEKLAVAGLKPLVLKGLICRSTYKELRDHRTSGDEDILIKIGEFEQCREILTGAGYIMENIHVTDKLLEKAHHISFFHPNQGLKIEVHISILGYDNNYRAKLNNYFLDVFDKCISIEIDGHWIYTLNHTAHYMFLFFHYVKHFTGSGVGIRQMLDIYMYDKLYHDEIDWNLIEDSIMEISAGSLYADLVNIGNKLMGFTIMTNLNGYNMEVLLTDTMASGAYGNITREQSFSNRFTESALNYGGIHIFKIIFPKAEILKVGYPILIDKSYLLPFIWVKRWIRFIIRRGPFGRKLIKNSLTIGKQRLRLLKDYCIIP
jgi:hypothetical protein